ncbi:MAG TPA: PilZ domain-containing protein [Nitrospirota bacterium]|nr:PilZ domain-containing protein [Nitrospirota bacterium]
MACRIALLGAHSYTFARLTDILTQAGFVVDTYDPVTIRSIFDNRLHTYNIVISSADLAKRLEEDTLFKSSIAARGFLVFDDKEKVHGREPSYLIHAGMNPEDIIAKINNIVFLSSSLRKSPRIKLCQPVVYEYEGNQCQSIIQDIGERGAFISTIAPPPDGTKITIHFFLPGERDIVASGHVVYSISCNLNQNIIAHPTSRERKIIALPGVGIMFDHITDADRAAIKNFMKKNR